MGLIYEIKRKSEQEIKNSSKESSFISLINFFESLVAYSGDTRLTIVNYLLSSDFCCIDYYTYDRHNNETKHTYENCIKNDKKFDIYSYPVVSYLERVTNEDDTHKHRDHYLKKADIVKIDEMIEIGIDSVEKLDSSLNQLDSKLVDAEEQITRLTTDYDIAQLKIDELTSQLLKFQNAAPADDSVLQTILDESHENHAPDLKHAINLWNDLYINGLIGTDSHSNKADIWIVGNTGYTDNDKSSIGRIREVATPFKDFGTKRSREEEK